MMQPSQNIFEQKNIRDELLIQILKFCNVKDIETVKLLSKYFYKISQDDALWANLIQLDLAGHFAKYSAKPTVKKGAKQKQYLEIFKNLYDTQFEEINRFTEVLSKIIKPTHLNLNLRKNHEGFSRLAER